MVTTLDKDLIGNGNGLFESESVGPRIIDDSLKNPTININQNNR
jgi:hypothetical protein